MARIKGGLNAKKRHNRTLKLAKGYRGARSKQYRIAKQSVMRALASSYAGRKQRKRQMRNVSALLDAYSPLKSLSRGYAIAYHEDAVISSIEDVEVNDTLRLRLQDGYIDTIIEKKENL